MTVLSVIIPVYNSEKTVVRCVESVRGQTYTDLEIICVNDGSTDSSLSLLEAIKEKESRIKIITKKNGGLSSARNAGIDIASGEYVGFVDADDYVEPHMYECLITLMEEDNCSLACAGTDIIYENCSSMVDKDEKLFEVKLGRKEAIRPGILRLMDTHVWNKLYRRDTIEKHKLRFPEGLWYEDLPFIYSYLSVSDFISFHNQKLYHYIRSEGTIMSSTFQGKNLKILDHIKIVYPVYDFIKSRNENVLEIDFIDLVIDSVLTSNHYLRLSKKHYLVSETLKLLLTLHTRLRFQVIRRFTERLGRKILKRFRS